MQKYHLKGLDCPNCAAEIEDSLKKLKGVREISLNFAAATLSLDADDMEVVRREIQRIEPDVEVIDVSSHEHGHEHSHDHSHEHDGEDFNIKRELGLIAVAAALLVTVLIFKYRLHAVIPYTLGEYFIFIPAYLLGGWGVLSSAGRNVFRGKIFDENFLMTVATLGAIAIHELPEAVGCGLALGARGRHARALPTLRLGLHEGEPPGDVLQRSVGLPL